MYSKSIYYCVLYIHFKESTLTLSSHKHLYNKAVNKAHSQLKANITAYTQLNPRNVYWLFVYGGVGHVGCLPGIGLSQAVPPPTPYGNIHLSSVTAKFFPAYVLYIFQSIPSTDGKHDQIIHKHCAIIYQPCRVRLRYLLTQFGRLKMGSVMLINNHSIGLQFSLHLIDV